MRYRDLISDEEFVKERTALQNNIAQLRNKISEIHINSDKWLELTENTFMFAASARDKFLKGTKQTKKEVLDALGSNPILNGGKLSIEAKPWLLPIKNALPGLMAQYSTIGPVGTSANKRENSALDGVILTIRGM